MKGTTGRLSLRSLVSVGAILVFLISAVGCVATPAPAPAAPAAGAEKGGKLVFTLPVEPGILDPNIGSSRYEAVVISALFDPLVFLDNEGEFLPNLIKSWDVDDAGLVWTFELRDDVTFHDGTPFNAEALKFNFDRMKAPETKSQAAGVFLGPYVGSEVVDDFTLEVTFNEPHATLFDRMAGAWLRPVSPASVEKFGEDLGTNTVGTGPFMFKEWIPRDHITLVPNPDYKWAPTGFHEGPPYLEEIRFNFIGEEISRVTALRNGETMVTLYTPPREAANLEAEGFQVLVNEVPGIARVNIINSQKAPTDDLRVRQAMLYGMDREAIVSVIDKGVGEALHNVISPGVWGYDPAMEDLYPHDPEKAKQLLEEAGWVDSDGDGIREKDGQNLSVLWVHFPGRTPGVPELIQGQLKELGFEMSIENRENPGNMQFARAGGHNLEWMTWGSTDPAILGTLFHSKNAGTGWNYAFYEDARLDEVLEMIDTTVDLEKRKALVGEAQRIIMEQALVMPLTIDINVVGIASGAKDLSFGPSGFYDVYFYDTYVEE